MYLFETSTNKLMPLLRVFIIITVCLAASELLTVSAASIPFNPYLQCEKPQSALLLAADGNFYGTTEYGGSSGDGTVFKLTPSGAFTVLVNFNFTDGANPYAGLIQGNDGNFYGTTYGGGSSGDGTVFKLTPAGALLTLVNFNGTNGANPLAGLIQDDDGNFYGTTHGGGSSDDGTVFKLTPEGTLTTLVSFNITNGHGATPFAGLIRGRDGNFYGTTFGTTYDTAFGVGSSSNGTVFKLTPEGTLTTLVNFNGSNGTAPFAGLIQDSDGNFYGTTAPFGSFLGGGNGTVFKLTPGRTLTTLVNFNSTNGADPQAGLIQGKDGNFYGTTVNGGSSGRGTVFKLTPEGALTTLVNFNGTNGANPLAGLTQGSDGNFYGTTTNGGSVGAGTVFKLTTEGTVTTLVNFDNINKSDTKASNLEK